MSQNAHFIMFVSDCGVGAERIPSLQNADALCRHPCRPRAVIVRATRLNLIWRFPAPSRRFKGDPMKRLPNEEMAALWNGASGQAWVDEQSLLDQTYEAIEKLLADAVAASGARSVLDIGCGAGATTLAVARTLGARGNVVGIDISDPLIAVARARAQREGLAANFIRAEAQTHDFAPASFDMMISRFGVM